MKSGGGGSSSHDEDEDEHDALYGDDDDGDGKSGRVSEDGFISRLDGLLSCDEMASLSRVNGNINERIQMMIYLLLNRNVSNMTMPVPDPAAESIYLAVVKRLNEKYRLKYGAPNELLTSLSSSSSSSNSTRSDRGARSGNPFASLFQRPDWICPLCQTVNSPDKRTCQLCEVNESIAKIVKGRDYVELVAQFLALSRQGFDIGLSTESLSEKTVARTSLKSDALTFLESRFLNQLEQQGLDLKVHFNSFFLRLLRGETNFSWKMTYRLDKNSVACFAPFISALSKEVIENNYYRGRVSVDSPSYMAEDEYVFRGIPDGRYHRGEIAAQVLLQGAQILDFVCRAVHFAPSTEHIWDRLLEPIVILDSTYNLSIRGCVDLLRAGVRDMDLLVGDLPEIETPSVIEALVHRILELEVTCPNSDSDNIDLRFLDVSEIAVGSNKNSNGKGSVGSGGCDDDDDDDGPPDLDDIVISAPNPSPNPILSAQTNSTYAASSTFTSTSSGEKVPYKDMKVKELFSLIDQRKLNRVGLNEKSELVQLLVMSDYGN